MTTNTTTTYKLIKSKPAVEGFRDRGMRYHVAAHWDIIDADGNVIVEIRQESKAGWGGAKTCWTARHTTTWRTKYCPSLTAAKAAAFELI